MLWANAGLIVTVIAWGSTAPVVHELLKTWDPLVLTAARFVLTAPVFLIWLRLAEGSIGRGSAGLPWRPVIVLSLLLGGFATIYTIGIRFANPITVAIIGSAGPVAAGVIDWLLTGRRIPRTVLTAIPLAVAGGAVATADFGGTSGVFDLRGGEILVVIAVVLWPLYSSLLQKWLDGASQLRRTALTFAGAAPILVASASLAVAFGIEDPPVAFADTGGWALFVWSSLAISIMGTLCWNIGVAHVGIVIATMFLNMIPMVAVLVSMLFGVEPRIEQLVGGLIVIVAVVQAQLRTFLAKRRGTPAVD